MRFNSLKSKLFFWVFALVVSSSGFISVFVVQNHKKTLFSAVKAQTENMAHEIALEAAEKVLVNDRVALQKLFDHHMASNPNVAYIFLVREGNILAHTFLQGVPVQLIPANAPVDAEHPNMKTIVTPDDRYLDVAWPVFKGKAGVLRMAVSERPYHRQIEWLWAQMGSLTLGVLFVAVISTHLFIRKVTGPLSDLAAAAERIDERHMEFAVNVNGAAEVRRLGAAFQAMVRRIKEYTHKLEEKTVQLGRAHDQARKSLAIVQKIGAQTSLREVCTYLIREIQGIVTCSDILFSVFGTEYSRLFVLSEKETRISGDTSAVKAFAEILEPAESLTFSPPNRLDPVLFPQGFPRAQRIGVLPFRFDGQLLGALLIPCPGKCICVSQELNVVELILAQTSGAVRRAVLREEEAEEIRNRVERSAEFYGIVGKNPRMQAIYRLIENIASTDAAVLIQGESGTGKELVAEAIHRTSLRKGAPFVVINCSAYPVTLLESELFGHEKGAFTGAVRRKPGRFEQADGGTVFLDEIGEMPVSAQIKLLRVLQTQKFERVGGETTLSVDVRIIAATNKDLKKEVETGRFREDLFYRLNVILIQIPPLRERKTDIPLLAHYFLKRFTPEGPSGITGFSSEAMRMLLEHPWPGNVRELENTIEHAAVLAKGSEIQLSDFPPLLASPETSGSLPTMSENEKRILQEMLETCRWNKKLTAQRLGISRSTLYGKMKKYRITKPTLH